LADQETRNAPPSLPQRSGIVKCVKEIRRQLQRRRAKKMQENATDRAARSTARATWAIAILTAATIGVALSQYVIFGRQLDVMENDKRPWIRVTLSLSKPVLLTEWSKQRGINVPLNFALKNYGQVPAININVSPSIIVHPGNPRRAELDAPQKTTCEAARIESDKNPIGGIAIFPNEAESIESNIATNVREAFTAESPVLFAVLGCVDYTYGNGRHGQTGFRFVLGKGAEGQVLGLPFIEGAPVQSYDIPEDLIKSGYPSDPPKIAAIPASNVYFKPADSGNYAK
jgi:hypothetical protein